MRRIRNLLLFATLFLVVACGGPAATPQDTGPLPPPTAGVGTSQYPVDLTQTPPPNFLPPPTPTLEPRQPDSLTTAELLARLDPFGNEDCKLPCYGGLWTGQSNTQDVIIFYSHLGISVMDLIPGDYPEVLDRTGRMGAWLTKTSDLVEASEQGFQPPQVDIYVEDDVARYIYVGWSSYLSYLELPYVLEMMGPPDQLSLGLIFGYDPATYILQLVYADKGVGFSYYGSTLGDAARRQVCLSDEQVFSIFFGSVSAGWIPMEGLEGEEYLLPLEETLAISYADFAAQMSGGGCLDVPASLWGPWQAIQAEIEAVIEATRLAIEATQTQMAGEAEDE